jgi:transcriptional regulator with XRE-family HTH domain
MRSTSKRKKRSAAVAVAFGLVLKELRTRKGLSEQSLATTAGVGSRDIIAIERGVREPTLVMLFKLAHALDVEPSSLLSRMEQKLQ